MDAEFSSPCKKCGKSFTVSRTAADFYLRVGVPKPTLCPECRQQRRISQINQINLFKGTCAATGKSLITKYPPESPYIVYSQAYWHSDAFDACSYGRDFDFSRPFFEQYHELSLVVPRASLYGDFLFSENAEYTNYAGKNKNCYMLFDSDHNEDCYYSYGINKSKNIVDCYRGQKLELCCQAIDCAGCYNCAFVFNSENCRDSAFLNSCIGCDSCFFCSNLQRKSNYVRNKPASREEIQRVRNTLSNRRQLEQYAAEFAEFRAQFPQRYMRGFHNEDVSGNHLVHSKNAYHCFDSSELWDCSYCYQMFMPSKDCVDCHELGEAELCYESSNGGSKVYDLRFSLLCSDNVSGLTYCNHCSNGSADLFGCIALKRKQHCILNKSCNRREYEALTKRIIAHMTETGEWGEFFPAETSAFPYNLTLAAEHFPLSKAEALALGYTWREPDAQEFKAASYLLPEDLSQVPDALPKELLACKQCRKNYKIIKQELDFYRAMNLALPELCFNCRHYQRVMSRTPHHLWKRNCGKCGVEFETAYAPGRSEKIYCAACFSATLL